MARVRIRLFEEGEDTMIQVKRCLERRERIAGYEEQMPSWLSVIMSTLSWTLSFTVASLLASLTLGVSVAIEEIRGKHLDSKLQSEARVAVFWCKLFINSYCSYPTPSHTSLPPFLWSLLWGKSWHLQQSWIISPCFPSHNKLYVLLDSKNCKTCDRVLGVLERVGEDVAGNGITLVRWKYFAIRISCVMSNIPTAELTTKKPPRHMASGTILRFHFSRWEKQSTTRETFLMLREC